MSTTLTGISPKSSKVGPEGGIGDGTSPLPLFSANVLARLGVTRLDWRSLTQTGDGEMARNRLVISLMILSYFLIEWAVVGRYLATPIFTISAFFLFSLTVAIHVLQSPEPNYLRRLISIFADIGTLSFGLYIGGEVTACTWPVYLWVIYGNGFRFGQKYLGLATITSVVCFGAVITFTPYWTNFYNLSLGLLFGLIVLPVYARKLINDLSVARQRAEAANKTKSLFLASVSHELRTPLNAINGLSECLTATRLDTEQSDMLSTIYRSGRTLSHLIENILDYSRLESGAMPCNVKEVDLPSLLADICAVARAQVNDKNVSFNLHLESDVPFQVSTDGLKLNQILTNFISNAIKFTDEGHVTLFISSREMDNETYALKFAVRDTGIGISENAQERIFERFTQANDKIVDRYGGTGLGLAIVKQTAELIGGQVGVVSTQGQGSTFWCEIPVPKPNSVELPKPSANLAFFVGNDMSESLRNQPWAFATAEFLRDYDELVASCERGRRDGKDNLLFTDSETHEVVADWLASRGDKIAHVIRLAQPNEAYDDLDLIQRTSIAKLPIDSSEQYVRSLVGWAGDVCNKKRKNAENLQPSVTPASILIAEDNPANQMVIRKIMTRAGHDFTIVDDGEGVMAALEDKTFDVILLDLNMPVMNGFETIKFIRFALHNEDVPVIAVTADATIETAEKCLEATFDAVVTKPYRAQTLLGAIDKHTEHLKNESDDREIGSVIDPVAALEAVHEMGAPDIKSDVLNLQQLQEIQELGPPDFFEGVVHTFLSECQKKLADLKFCAEKKHQHEVSRLAHGLKSSALNLGATQVVKICNKLEDQAEASDLGWTKDMVEDLDTAVGVCSVELLDYLEQISEHTQPRHAVSYH